MAEVFKQNLHEFFVYWSFFPVVFKLFWSNFHWNLWRKLKIFQKFTFHITYWLQCNGKTEKFVHKCDTFLHTFCKFWIIFTSFKWKLYKLFQVRHVYLEVFSCMKHHAHNCHNILCFICFLQLLFFFKTFLIASRWTVVLNFQTKLTTRTSPRNTISPRLKIN